MNTLNIYWGEIEKAPYDIHTSGDILSSVNSAVLGELIKLDEGYNLKPASLEQFYFDYKKRVYILKLRSDLKYHNGRSANSKDLEFTLLRGFFVKDNNFFRNYLGAIKGLDKIKEGDKFESGKVEGIKIIDDQTLSVELNRHEPAFLNTLTIPYFALVPQEELQDDYFTWKTAPVGVGKYKIKNPFDGAKTVLENKSKKFNVIIHTKHHDKNIYDLSITPDKIKKASKFTPRRPVQVRILEISNQNLLGKNDSFKKGMAILLNKINVANDELGIRPTSQILPSHFWGRATNTVKNATLSDVQKIFSEIPKEIFDQEHCVPVYSGGQFTSRHLFYIEKISDIFLQAGLKIKFYPSQEKFVSKETAEKCPLFMSGRISDYIDPMIMFSTYASSGHNKYYQPIGELGRKYDELYEEALNATDLDSRVEKVRKLSQFVRDENVTIALAEESIIYYYDSKRIKTFGSQPHALTLNLESIELKN